MNKGIILSAAAMFLALSTVQGQDFKPVKDKATKKFGYQDDSKNWVIAPEFDKAKKFEQGVAIVTIDKMEGVIDTEGNEIIPCECKNVKIDNKYEIIHAERYFEVENPDYYLEPSVCAWGLYSLDGTELFAPQFETRLSFNKDGLATATDKGTGKQGVVTIDGEVALPVDFHYVSSELSGYKALNDAMRIVTYSKDFRTVSDDNLPQSAPWMPLPYSTDGDVVRAFAYGLNHIGEKLYKNRIWDVVLQNPQGTRIAATTYQLCSTDGNLVDWGNDPGTFIRLEPVIDNENHEGSFLYGITGARYTVQARMYDALGHFIRNISDWGCLYAMSNEGLIYQAEGQGLCFISHDVNWTSNPVAVNLTGYSLIDNSTLNSALGVTSGMQNEMRDYWKSKRRHADVAVKEKTGYQSYRPFVPVSISSREGRFLDDLEMKYPFLRRNYRAGQVYGIKSVKHGDAGQITVGITPDLPATYRDDYGNGFMPKIVEPVFWGVKGDRYIRIIAVPFNLSTSEKAAPEKVDGMVDDTPESGMGVRFVFNLYEDDGTFVRTIGHSSRLTLAGHDVFGFEDIGWLFTRAIPELGDVKFREFAPPTNSISYLKNVDF